MSMSTRGPAAAAVDEPPGRLEPVEVRHADVHQDDVGVELAGCPERLLAVARLADDLDVRLRLEDHAEARAHESLVVDDQDTDAHASPSLTGSRAEMR